MIGIVGGIGSGKSLAAATLAQLGLHRLDADAVGHSLLTQRPTREAVVERFGNAILLPADPAEPEAEPVVDRRALGRVVFHDPNARRDLEAIMHPLMRKTFERAIARAGRSNLPGVVLDAAILFEAGWNDLCDAVIFVDAPADVRMARVAAERNWSPEDFEAREAAQASLDSKKSRADVVLTNSGSPDEFRTAVLAWWNNEFKASAEVPPRSRPAKPRPSPGSPRGRRSSD